MHAPLPSHELEHNGAVPTAASEASAAPATEASAAPARSGSRHIRRAALASAAGPLAVGRGGQAAAAFSAVGYFEREIQRICDRLWAGLLQHNVSVCGCWCLRRWAIVRACPRVRVRRIHLPLRFFLKQCCVREWRGVGGVGRRPPRAHARCARAVRSCGARVRCAHALRSPWLLAADRADARWRSPPSCALCAL
jgi:hypothetical protein